jgi:hypothetical protein
MEGLMAPRSKLRMGTLALASLAAAAIGTGLIGCAETMSLAELPNVTRLPEKLLTKEEQAAAVNNMAEKAQTQQAEAAKEIDKASSTK